MVTPRLGMKAYCWVSWSGQKTKKWMGRGKSASTPHGEHAGEESQDRPYHCFCSFEKGKHHQ